MGMGTLMGWRIGRSRGQSTEADVQQKRQTSDGRSEQQTEKLSKRMRWTNDGGSEREAEWERHQVNICFLPISNYKRSGKPCSNISHDSKGFDRCRNQSINQEQTTPVPPQKKSYSSTLSKKNLTPVPPDSFYTDHAYPPTYLPTWLLTPRPTPLAYFRYLSAYFLPMIPSYLNLPLLPFTISSCCE